MQPGETLEGLDEIRIGNMGYRWIIQYHEKGSHRYIATSIQFGLRIYTVIDTDTMMQGTIEGYSSAQLVEGSIQEIVGVARRIHEITQWTPVKIERLPKGLMPVTESPRAARLRRRREERVSTPTEPTEPPTPSDTQGGRRRKEPPKTPAFTKGTRGGWPTQGQRRW